MGNQLLQVSSLELSVSAVLRPGQTGCSLVVDNYRIAGVGHEPGKGYHRGAVMTLVMEQEHRSPNRVIGIFHRLYI